MEYNVYFQVPAQFSELNSSDIFVLVDIPWIIKFNIKVKHLDYGSSSVASKILAFIQYESHLHDLLCRMY